MVVFAYAALVTDVVDEASLELVMYRKEGLPKALSTVQSALASPNVWYGAEPMVNTLLDRKRKALQDLSASNRHIIPLEPPATSPAFATAFCNVDLATTDAPVTFSDAGFACANPLVLDFGSRLVGPGVVERMLIMENSTNKEVKVRLMPLEGHDPLEALSVTPFTDVVVAPGATSEYRLALRSSVGETASWRTFKLEAGGHSLKVVVKSKLQHPAVSFSHGDDISMPPFVPFEGNSVTQNVEVRNDCDVPLLLRWTRSSRSGDVPDSALRVRHERVKLPARGTATVTLTLRTTKRMRPRTTVEFEVWVGVSSSSIVKTFTVKADLVAPTWQLHRGGSEVRPDSNEHGVNCGQLETGREKNVTLHVSNTCEVPLPMRISIASRHFTLNHDGTAMTVPPGESRRLNVQVRAPKGLHTGTITIESSGTSMNYMISAFVGTPKVVVLGKAKFVVEASRSALAAQGSNRRGYLIAHASVAMSNHGSIDAQVRLPSTSRLKFTTRGAPATVLLLPARRKQNPEVKLEMRVEELVASKWTVSLPLLHSSQSPALLCCEVSIKNADISMSPGGFVHMGMLAAPSPAIPEPTPDDGSGHTPTGSTVIEAGHKPGKAKQHTQEVKTNSIAGNSGSVSTAVEDVVVRNSGTATGSFHVELPDAAIQQLAGKIVVTLSAQNVRTQLASSNSLRRSEPRKIQLRARSVHTMQLKVEVQGGCPHGLLVFPVSIVVTKQAVRVPSRTYVEAQYCVRFELTH